MYLGLDLLLDAERESEGLEPSVLPDPMLMFLVRMMSWVMMIMRAKLKYQQV